MSNDPLVALQQQLGLVLGQILAVGPGSVGALGQHNDVLEALVAGAAGGEVQSGLIHLDGGTLFHEEDLSVLNAVGVVLDEPGVTQDQHEVGDGDIDLAALVILKAVISGVAAVAVTDLDGHTAVEHIFHVLLDAISLHLGNGSEVDVAVFRDSGLILHILDQIGEVIAGDDASVGSKLRAVDGENLNIIDLIESFDGHSRYLFKSINSRGRP